MSMNKVRTNLNKNEPSLIHWGGDDPFTHSLIVGPTRCGKTSTVLQPIIYQILLAKKRGERVGLSVIEPKGDVARMVKEMAEEMGLNEELTYIDPLFPEETNRINVMKGDKDNVAEATVAVLKSLFGKQDAFFATVQELSSRKVTLLLKELYEDNMDIMDVLANLRDVSILQSNVEKLRSLQGTTDLVSFFDNELLGTGNMADKYRQFIVGLRAQLENITANRHLRAIVTGKSDIDLDEHMEKGGILCVNSALGLLGKSGDAFGMFIAMHLQLATFRRPGTEKSRVPHYIIIDEFSRYINPDVERFLSIAASYRVALVAAIQSLGQLEIESGVLSARAMKKAILTSTRNKIIFGGLEYEDADEVSKIMGKDVVRERTRMFDGGILANILPKSYRDEEAEKERFYATFIMDGLPRFHYVHKLLKGGTPQEPGVAVGDFVPRDWKERFLAEQEELLNQKKPPLFDWRKRAEYEVNKQRLIEAQRRQEHAKVVLAVNPFEIEEKPVETVNKTNDDIPKVIEIKTNEIVQSKQSIEPTEPVVKKSNPFVFTIGSKSSEKPVEPVLQTEVDKNPTETKERVSEPVNVQSESPFVIPKNQMQQKDEVNTDKTPALAEPKTNEPLKTNEPVESEKVTTSPSSNDSFW